MDLSACLSDTVDTVCLYVHLQFLSVCVYIFIYLQFLNIYYLSVGIFYTNGWLEHHIYIAAVCVCLGCLIMTECMNTVLLSQWSVWGCVVCTCVSLGYVQLSCSLQSVSYSWATVSDTISWPLTYLSHSAHHVIGRHIGETQQSN